MKKVAAALVAIAKSLVAEPMSYEEPAMSDVRQAKRTLMMTCNIDSSWKTVFEQFLTVMEGTSNKYHYFAVFQSRTGVCVGGNAYGRIGYNPKAIELARGSMSSVMGAVREKMYNKQRQKGYQITEV